MQAVDRDRSSVLPGMSVPRISFSISKYSAHPELNTNSSSGSSQFGIISNNKMVSISKSRADGGKTTVEAAEAVCGVHITI